MLHLKKCFNTYSSANTITKTWLSSKEKRRAGWMKKYRSWARSYKSNVNSLTDISYFSFGSLTSIKSNTKIFTHLYQSSYGAVYLCITILFNYTCRGCCKLFIDSIAKIESNWILSQYRRAKLSREDQNLDFMCILFHILQSAAGEALQIFEVSSIPVWVVS